MQRQARWRSTWSVLRKKVRPCSGQCAGVIEFEARQAAEHLGGVTVAEVDQEVDGPRAAGEELGIHLDLVEARHGARVEAERARGEQQIAGLERSVAECRLVRNFGAGREPALRIA